ncbi:hypothetical protein [Methylocella silvestris]|uniref:hypothetical protein n=1 Tax=Methylocella silvestris TaxID=199596 RepID=UPI0002E2E631|nr:hypothetical protein [Methylocella silvestris]
MAERPRPYGAFLTKLSAFGAAAGKTAGRIAPRKIFKKAAFHTESDDCPRPLAAAQTAVCAAARKLNCSKSIDPDDLELLDVLSR